MQINPRVASKLQENLVDRNNLSQSGNSCKVNQRNSMNAMSNSLNPKFSQFQQNFYSKSSPQLLINIQDYQLTKHEQLFKRNYKI